VKFKSWNFYHYRQDLFLIDSFKVFKKGDIKNTLTTKCKQKIYRGFKKKLNRCNSLYQKKQRPYYLSFMLNDFFKTLLCVKMQALDVASVGKRG